MAPTDNAVVTCTGTSWSKTPTCSVRNCPTAPTVTNANPPIASGTNVGSYATYSCKTGHTLIGKSTITCLSLGQWSLGPKCESDFCGVPVTIANSKLTFTSQLKGATAVYQCNTGYYLLNGLDTSTCLDTRKWSTVPFCKSYDCGAPPTLSNGARSFSSTSPASIASYTCDVGYTLVGMSNAITCSNTGVWSTAPKCDQTYCGTPPLVQYGKLKVFTGQQVNNKATYVCDTGYEIQGAADVTCQISKAWTTPPTCKAKYCPVPPSIANTKVSHGVQPTEGDKATYYGDSGFTLTGDTTVTCIGGTWTKPTFTVEATHCGQATKVPNAVLTYSSQLEGAKASYQCNTGYIRIGSSPITCQNKAWGTTPTCKLLTCSSPPQAPGGERTYGGLFVGDRASYECFANYALIGQPTIECQSDGTWGIPPTCRAKQCGVPIAVQHATVVYTRQDVGATATYSCSTGYRISGAATVNCVTGPPVAWSTAPTCTIVDCGKPSAPAQGSVVAQVTTYGNRATFSCNNNYKLVGQSSALCLSDGTWSSQIPKCEVIGCGKPPGIAHGKLSSYTGQTVGSTAQYVCDTGYKFTSTNIAPCVGVNNWQLPTCNPVDCGTPTITDGKAVYTATTFGSTATFSCNSGFTMIGISPVTCLSDATWSSKPTCQSNGCRTPPVVQKASCHYTSQQTGATATYKCEVGYKIVGSPQVQCQANSQWTAAPTCNMVDCGAPADIGGQQNKAVTSTLYNGKTTYTCDSTHVLIGNSVITCQADGQWTSIPRCEKRFCGVPPDVANGVVKYSGQMASDTAVFTCATGYTLKGSNTITCQTDRNWTAEPTCLGAGCGPPPAVDSADTPRYTTTTVGSQASYTCKTSFTMVGSKDVTCQADGSWSQLPKCQAAHCQNPPSLSNAKIINLSGLKQGDTVTYQCDNGYEFTSGTGTSTCQVNKSWSALPTCSGKNCGTIPTVPKATHVNNPPGTTYQKTVQYTCSAGYTAVGNNPITCLATGKWESPPSCQATFCGTPPLISHGSREYYGQIAGSVAIYTCVKGSTMTGYAVSTCHQNRTWSTPPKCSKIPAKNCPVAPNVAGGKVKTNNGQTVGSTVIYECNAGFILFGSATITCQNTITWSPSPSCEAVSCNVPPTVQNAVYSGYTSQLPGATVTYSCNAGNLVGTAVVTCLSGNAWSTPPSCSAKQCPSAPTVPNANKISSGNVAGSTATYTCNPGKTIAGKSQIFCKADGTWETPPICEDTFCGQPKSILYGDVQYTTQASGGVATYSCNIGYTISTPDKATCQSNKQWTAAPTCTPKRCGAPSGIAHGSVSSSGDSVGDRAMYSCSSGYTLIGNPIRTCTTAATWTAISKCEVTACGVPPIVAKGTVSFTSQNVGATASYTCENGYQLSGAQLTCLQTKTWSTAPTCQAVTCGNVPTVASSTNTNTGSTFGSSVTYACDNQHTMIGPASSTCKKDGSWTVKPKCEPTFCGVPPSISNGKPGAFSSQSQGSSVTYSCNDGYTVTGNAAVTCQTSKDWSPLPDCKPKDCAAPTKPTNGKVSFSGTTLGYKVTYSCTDGFVLVGKNEATCASNGWSPASPTCEAMFCGLPVTIQNGGYHITSQLKGATATYYCNPGYTLQQSTPAVICLDTRLWSTTPKCISNSCGEPPSVVNGLYTKTGTAVGDKTTYQCKTGFTIAGRSSATCGTNSAWTEPPKCEATFCGVPVSVTNGKMVYKGQLQGDKTTYACNAGYKLVGSGTITCQSDKQWSTLPMCKAVDCGVPPGINRGRTAAVTTTYGSTSTYMCNANGVLIGQATVTCATDGRWTAPPRCEDLFCGLPIAPTNGKVLTNNGQVQNSKSTYVCDLGYELVGSIGTSVCQQTKKWSPTVKCNPKSCSSLPSPFLDGQVLATRTTYGGTATFTCKPSFTAVTKSQIKCQSDGTWSSPFPQCQGTFCGNPPDIENGEKTFTSQLKDSKVTYSCKTGYQISGNAQLTCLATKAWSAPPPTCTIKDCGNPPVVARAKRSFLTTTYLSLAEYTCTSSATRTLVNQNTCQCKADSSWAPSLRCEDTFCGYPAQVDHGEYKYDGQLEGDKAVYTCKPGYRMIGDSTIVCQPDRKWSKLAPQCAAVDCGKPPDIQNQKKLTYTQTKFGYSASYECKNNFILMGKFITCQKDAKWSTLPVCEAVVCGHPTSVSNGKIEYTSQVSGATAKVTCDKGFTIKGASSVTCDGATKTWSKPGTCEAVSCPIPPPEIPNASKIFTKTQTTYTCEPKFTMVGSSTTTCQNNGAWSVHPICNDTICGSPPQISHGSRTFAGQGEGDTARYTCNTGYKIQGAYSIKCTNNKWPSAPSCLASSAVGCPQATPISNGKITGVDYRIGAAVTYSCNAGLTLVGSVKSTCQPDRTWSPVPKCEETYCGQPTPIAHGSVKISGQRKDDVATFTCDTGYKLSSPFTSVCQSTQVSRTGQWSASPSCTVVDCGAPPTVANGSPSTTSNTKYNNKVVYTCANNFILVGKNEIKCLASGQWEKAPTCEGRVCGAPPVVTNGARTFTGQTKDATATYTCDLGYNQSGGPTIKCVVTGGGNTGNWETAPACNPVNCGVPPPITNGDRTVPPATTLNNEVTYTCSPSYIMIGSNKVTCPNDGQWPAPPKCQVQFCGQPPAINNGRFIATGQREIDSAQYSCLPGFILTGNNILYCLASRTWTSPAPTCVAKDCGNPPDVAFSTKTSTGNSFGSTTTYTCNPGYQLQGQSVITCETTSLWSPRPTCAALSCPVPPDITHGSKVSTGNTYGSTAEYTCNAGYTIAGTNPITCKVDGKWAVPTPVCEVTFCNVPPKVENSKTTYSSQTDGSIATYTCNPSFSLVGTVSTVTCKSDKTWTNPPKCQAQGCGVPPVVDGGQYTLSDTGLQVGSRATYTCSQGLVINGQATIACQANGNWESPPQCLEQTTSGPGQVLTGSSKWGIPVGVTVSVVLLIVCAALAYFLYYKHQKANEAIATGLLSAS
ncbi:sushi, von Willebrand factor type A, EGF and pentraxin domain-containing protein 1-like [Tubulanus polymorphus]|uniref:sushi, von Willebrand factor type A, EGF and pentraxin domain-containing protein 1-like n=1 Tax=Tubulanus polymorphus TaxID=672921 RepID=UPI003DA3D0E5